MPVSPGSLLVPLQMGRNSLACEQVLEQKRWKSEGYHLILGLLPIRKGSREHWLMSGDNILEYASALISYIYHLSLVPLRHSLFWEWLDYYERETVKFLSSKFGFCSPMQRNSCERWSYWCVRPKLFEKRKAFQKSKGKSRKEQCLKLIRPQ